MRAVGSIGVATVCALVLAGCSAGASAPPSTAAVSSTTGPAAAGQSVDIGGRQVYIDCRGPVTAGQPTIILVSGYHDSSDVWNSPDVLSLITPAAGPPVQDALAASHRICRYDRPGTLRYIDGTPLTDRSTPVPQPRTLGDLASELHELLRAADVPEPYVLVGHSMGGLLVRLYGQTYADQIAGIVFVDAFSPTVPTLLGDKWPIYRDRLTPPLDQETVPALRDPNSEQIDVDASVAQVDAAKPLPAKPLAVLTKTEPFAGLADLPGCRCRPVRSTTSTSAPRRASSPWPPRRRRSSRRGATTTSSSPNPIWLSTRPTWWSAAFESPETAQQDDLSSPKGDQLALADVDRRGRQPRVLLDEVAQRLDLLRV
jgi:pimeloyl-ACP methyl ester carboxylesterase